MDTRFWGPSAWQLFHLIAHTSPHPHEVLGDIASVLPCRYCRESTAQFVKEMPVGKNAGKWVYDLHNKVNDKLRKQAKTDPTVVAPDASPSFEEVKDRYTSMKPTNVPGRDFLFAIAYNYPETPEPTDMATHRTFLHHLADAYPFQSLRQVFRRYIEDKEPTLDSRKTYISWMYGLLKALSKKIGVPIRSLKGYVQHVAYYKSGCSKKTYKGKTCRKVQGGGYTKDRDRQKTYRVSHQSLLEEE